MSEEGVMIVAMRIDRDPAETERRLKTILAAGCEYGQSGTTAQVFAKPTAELSQGEMGAMLTLYGLRGAKQLELREAPALTVERDDVRLAT